jgi:uncharacterized protein YegJ (DUF2314 family)
LQTGGEDEELRRIALQARAEFPDFIRRLQNPGAGEKGFRVKYPYPAGKGSGFRYEEIWLRDISFMEGKYHGKVANQPYYIPDLSLGDEVVFYGEDITDWMYERKGYIVGGLSIKYLAGRIPEPDRDRELNEWLDKFKEEE